MDSTQYGVQTTQSDINTSSGIYSHADGTTEDDALIYLALKDKIEITLDMTNMTQSVTVRIYEKTDGTNYRQVTRGIYPTEFSPNEVIAIEITGKGMDNKITVQSGVTEGDARDIPWARSDLILV
jgi:hypothetical protein